ncbi:MAG: PPOX class F420-dependent oxidoreductase [Actinomycetota bacterium]
MKKIANDDRRAQYKASDLDVDPEELRGHVAGKHRWVLATTRRDGRPQMSLVTGGMAPDQRLLITSYPSRVKVKNARRNAAVSVLVMGEAFDDAWLQVDGTAEVVDAPDGLDDFVEYFRCISGEHSDWDEYRQAMIDQGKSLIAITPTRWSPLSRGGFPPELFED